jgi:serine protease inhibitor
VRYYGNHFRRMGPRVGALLAAGMLGRWSPVFADSHAGATLLSSPTDGPIEMVQRTGIFRYWYGRFESVPFQAAALRLLDPELSILVVLPDAGHDLRGFVASITTDRLHRWRACLRPCAGSIALPSFARAHGDWLGEAVDSLSAPAPIPGLETGFDMVVDRPFFYAVWDERTDELTFIGVLTDPNYSAALAISDVERGPDSSRPVGTLHLE